ncbi:MAG: hypothetical protein AAF680_08930 [Pseudomonadota bacterium]
MLLDEPLEGLLDELLLVDELLGLELDELELELEEDDELLELLEELLEEEELLDELLELGELGLGIDGV